jgi:hypothetical protein
MPQFEFDPEKSESNKKKHGIDFVEAQEIWKDQDRIVYPSTSLSEPRTLVLGMARGLLWAAVVTDRDQAIRIISVRRARTYERRKYYEETQ